MDQSNFRDVQTYSELRNVYRQWLQGKIKTSPTYAGPPNEETLPYIPQLIRMNEHGLLTMGSQPGTVELQPDGSVQEQRGYLHTYMYADLVEAISKILPVGDIIMITDDEEWEDYRHIEGGEDIPVSRVYPSVKDYNLRRNAEDVTWFPTPSISDRSHWDIILYHISPKSHLRNENQKPILVMFLDPIWGREGRIFDVITYALTLITNS